MFSHFDTMPSITNRQMNRRNWYI